MISDGKFLIVPDPYQKLTSLEIADNELMDSNKTIGIISLKGISNNNYTITQKASNDNYLPTTISKVVEIKDDDSPISSVLFVNNFNYKSSFYVKFVSSIIKKDNKYQQINWIIKFQYVGSISTLERLNGTI